MNTLGDHQTGLAQQSLHRSLDVVISGSRDRRASYQDHIPTCRNTLASEPYDLTQPALDPVANNRFTHPPAGGKAKPAESLLVGQCTKNQETIVPAGALTAHLLEPLALAQPKIAFQRLPRPLAGR